MADGQGRGVLDKVRRPHATSRRRRRPDPHGRSLAGAGTRHVSDVIFGRQHVAGTRQKVEIAEEFEPEFFAVQQEVQDEILTVTRQLGQSGPQSGRLRVDTLNSSRHANMKKLRFGAAGGQWRTALAFELARRAMLLVAGDKAGSGRRGFYHALIRRADGQWAILMSVSHDRN